MSPLHSWIRHLIYLVVAAVVTPGLAAAQENIGAGRTEIVTAVFGGGAVFMPAATSGRSVTNNVLVGVSVTRNLTPRLGLEGDVTVALGRRDAHALYGLVSTNQKAPNMLFYGANLVYSPFRSDRRIVPYVEAGLGLSYLTTAYERDTSTSSSTTARTIRDWQVNSPCSTRTGCAAR